MTGSDETIAATLPPEGSARSDTGAARMHGSEGMREPTRGTIIGRYVVLAKLGAGGMGLVLVAYDPELDRKVALKLLRSVDEHGRHSARLQREAQALARLHHANVVTVHDVGVHEGRAFVAMEFVEGKTLGAWLAEAARSWREVLHVFEAVGRGLAAAHDAGLVHRDVKPDNVMLGHDGRVLVMDFGLARADEEEAGPTPEAFESASSLSTPLTQTGALMGTPAYMAPEQFSGLEVTARSDQFSYCVAFHEALYGVRPFAGHTAGELALSVTAGTLSDRPRDRRVPPWLRKAVLRGLSRSPDDRFATMTALLAALRAGEARRRRGRRLALAAGVGLVVVGAVGIQRYDLAQRVESCAAEGNTIDDVWNAEAREAVRAGLATREVGYASTVADKVMPWIDRNAESWREHATAACTSSEVDRTWDATTYSRAQWCLEESRVELSLLIGSLVAADEQIPQNAVQIAAGLPDPGQCVDARALVRMADPPGPEIRTEVVRVREELLRAHHVLLGGDYEEALGLARAARDRAEAVGWPPTIASARGTEASALGWLARPEAEAEATAAFMYAAREGIWDVAAQVAIDLTDLVGYRLARRAEGTTWAELAAVAIAHAADPLLLLEASRLNALGSMLYAAADYVGARAQWNASLAIFEQALGPAHPQVAVALNNLGNADDELGEPLEAKSKHARALALRTESLGPAHPAVGGSWHNLGAVHSRLQEHAEAMSCYERALSILDAALGAGSERSAATRYNLATEYAAIGERERAILLLEEALAVRRRHLGPEHPDVAVTLDTIGIVHQQLHDYAAAKPLHAEALAIWEGALGPDHPDVARALAHLGYDVAELGDNEQGRTLLERALTIQEGALGRDHPAAAYTLYMLGPVLADLGEHGKGIEALERAVALRTAAAVSEGLLALTRFELAKVLWDAPPSAGGDRPRARELAELADAALGGDAEQQAEVRRWLAEHPLDGGE